MESGRIDGVTIGTLVGLFEAVAARVEVEVRWQGAGLDRLLDEGHARLSGQVASHLRNWGWDVEVEVSFAHFGERGSIDLLAWHAPTATLLVIEIKTSWVRPKVCCGRSIARHAWHRGLRASGSAGAPAR